jgi:hypothetical protein
MLNVVLCSCCPCKTSIKHNAFTILQKIQQQWWESAPLLLPPLVMPVTEDADAVHGIIGNDQGILLKTESKTVE